MAALYIWILSCTATVCVNSPVQLSHRRGAPPASPERHGVGLGTNCRETNPQCKSTAGVSRLYLIANPWQPAACQSCSPPLPL